MAWHGKWQMKKRKTAAEGRKDMHEVLGMTMAGLLRSA